MARTFRRKKRSVTSTTGCCTIGSPDFFAAAGYNSIRDPRQGARLLPVFIPTRRPPGAILRRDGIAKCLTTEFALATTVCCGVGWPTQNSIQCLGRGITTKQTGVGGDR